MNRDVIVIGGSTGALKVLLELAAGLPADLEATLFVVVHTAPEYPSLLPELMNNRGALRASHPFHGERTVPGHIYIAPPDNHLLVREGSVEVVRGPKENGHRPAADPMFRTASAAYGPRVIGVVLSGNQDCGTAGMMSIRARGGIGVVQDPSTATAPEMPRTVLERVGAEHVVTPDQLPALLSELARTTAEPAAELDVLVEQLEGKRLGKPAELVCPLCSGVLTTARVGVYEQFRCHVGHAFSLASLVREQSDAMERSLWAAVRSLEEGAALSERLSRKETGELARLFAEKARTQLAQADLIRQMLLHGRMLESEDATRLDA